MGKNDESNESKSRKSLTRRERKMQKTREEILKAAKKLFEEKEFDDIIMENISEKADLSRATLYNHFSSKENIYFEIGITDLNSLAEKEKSFLDSSKSGLEQLLDLCQHFLQSQFDSPLVHEITRKYLILNKQTEIPAHITLEKLHNKETVEDPLILQLAKYLQALRAFEKNWGIVLMRGHKDGSINHKILNNEQFIHYLFLIILGIIDRAQLEQFALKKVNLTKDKLLAATLDLIRKDLTN